MRQVIISEKGKLEPFQTPARMVAVVNVVTETTELLSVYEYDQYIGNEVP